MYISIRYIYTYTHIYIYIIYVCFTYTMLCWGWGCGWGWGMQRRANATQAVMKHDTWIYTPCPKTKIGDTSVECAKWSLDSQRCGCLKHLNTIKFNIMNASHKACSVWGGAQHPGSWGSFQLLKMPEGNEALNRTGIDLWMESNSFLLSGWQWKIPLRRSESSRTRSDSGLSTTSKHCQFVTCSYASNVSMQPELIATAFYGKEQTALGSLRLWRCGHWDSSITTFRNHERMQHIKNIKAPRCAKTTKNLGREETLNILKTNSNLVVRSYHVLRHMFQCSSIPKIRNKPHWLGQTTIETCR